MTLEQFRAIMALLDEPLDGGGTLRDWVDVQWGFMMDDIIDFSMRKCRHTTLV